MPLADDHAALLAQYAAAAHLLDAHDEAWLRTPRPEVSQWSAAQHLAHVEAVNRSVLGGLRRLERDGSEATPEPAQPAGLRWLDAGTLPRGVVRAPEAVTFPADLSLGTLRTSLDAHWQRWKALDLDALAAWTGTLPHPLLGPLTAAQWVRFARVHTGHHHAIIAELSL